MLLRDSLARLQGYVGKHWQYLSTAGVSPGVDAYRALAICMVVLFHESLILFGWLGIDLFFVVSRFLIGGIIVDRLQIGAWTFVRFYRDRALRILPLYYFMLALFVCLAVSRSPQEFDHGAIKTIVASALFAHTTPNWLFKWGLNPNYMVPGSWSLVIEEYFYLVAPLTIFWLFNLFGRRLNVLAAALCIMAAAILVGKLIMAQVIGPSQFLPFYLDFPFKFDALIHGLVAALCVRYFKPNKISALTLAILGWSAILTSIVFLRGTSEAGRK